MDYIGQIFGNREIIRDYCVEADWTKYGMKVPNRVDHYKLTRCLNCGRVLPSLMKNLRCQPPKRCVYCSNIGNHSNIKPETNSWAVYDDYAVCNIIYDGKVVSFYIDSNDYDRTKVHVWRISKKRQKYYVITGSKKKNTMIYLHAFILGEHADGYEIDHIDGNSLNNRRSNLRLVSRQENIDNQIATRIDNQIGIRGIAKIRNKYKVDFHYHGKRFYTKDWPTINDAVWCRYCFEDYYNLPSIKNNPLAEQYLTLDDNRKEEIRQYVMDKILENER